MKSQDDVPSKKSNFITDQIDADIQSGRFNGRVQTRFPPEPNGYLHVGHAKAICLNHSIAKDYSGLFNLRYDDTNPVTENSEFVTGMREDIQWLLEEDLESTPLHTSEYFDQLYAWAEELIMDGKAYVDSQDHTDTTYSAGTLLDLSSTTFNVDLSEAGEAAIANGDYILFFGQSPDRWELNESNQLFEFHKHLYMALIRNFL